MAKERPSSLLLSSKVKELINSSEWTLDHNSTEKIPRGVFTKSVYKNIEGKALIVLEDGAGRIYDSSAAWFSFIEEVLQHKLPSHFLDGRLPKGQSFASSASELAKELAAQLNIAQEELDQSKISLEKIDRAIKQKGQQECLEAEVFEPLVAYVGEVVKCNLPEARWEMRIADDGNTWEPWIITPSKECPIASVLFDELSEEPDCSITAVADVCLHL